MKKSIAALALTASSTSAFALGFPPSETKTICLDVYENEDGVKYAGGCDQAKNNATLEKPLLANGCAEGQVSLVAQKFSQNFDINVHSCMPPNVVQL